MCKCTPEIRTPFCGRGDCLPPSSRAQDMEREFAAQAGLDRIWAQAVRQAEGGVAGRRSLGQIDDATARALVLHFGLKGAIDYATKIFQMGGPLAKEYGWLADYLTTYKAATEVGRWPATKKEAGDETASG